MMEIGNKLGKLSYLVEDSSEKPAWKEKVCINTTNLW